MIYVGICGATRDASMSALFERECEPERIRIGSI